MTADIDEILAAITDLSDRIDSPSTREPERTRLIAERTALREQARAIADATRHPQSIEAEISMLEARLSEIDGFLITKGHSEKYLHNTIQDPSAYSASINTRLTDHHAEEVEEIRIRLERLRSIRASQEDE